MKYLGLSEVAPAHVRRAHAIHPITLVEMCAAAAQGACARAVPLHVTTKAQRCRGARVPGACCRNLRSIQRATPGAAGITGCQLERVLSAQSLP